MSVPFTVDLWIVSTALLAVTLAGMILGSARRRGQLEARVAALEDSLSRQRPFRKEVYERLGLLERGQARLEAYLQRIELAVNGAGRPKH